MNVSKSTLKEAKALKLDVNKTMSEEDVVALITASTKPEEETSPVEPTVDAVPEATPTPEETPEVPEATDAPVPEEDLPVEETPEVLPVVEVPPVVEDTRTGAEKGASGPIHDTVPGITVTALEIIRDADLTVGEKLDWLASRSEGYVKAIASTIIAYNDRMKPGVGDVDPKQGVSNNYNLYATLKRVLETEDYTKFKELFDIVNFIFVAYAEEGLSQVYLARFTHVWRWSKRELTSYVNIINVISELADHNTRANVIRRVDVKRAVNVDQTTFTAKVLENLARYYEL